MALFVANNGQLQTVKGIYYGMTEDYINATLFHNLVPKTATEIRFLYASDNPDLTDYQKLGYCDNNNFIEVWNSGTKYILINPSKNYIYAPVDCNRFFNDYTSLITCIFDNFDTRKVTNMQSMFYNCSSLTSLDLSSFNTTKVRYMAYMFFSCNNLISLDLSNFNTQNVTLFLFMFYGCGSLATLIGVLNVSKAVTFAGFAVYAKITTINFIGNPINCTTFNDMFALCNRLTTIYSQTFTIKAGATSEGMFSGCQRLVGGNGTTFSSSHTNAEYARVDGEDGLPGYFTAPTN